MDFGLSSTIVSHCPWFLTLTRTTFVGGCHSPLFIYSRVCLKVSQGLDYLWREHRAIHRDIKPGNVLINTDGDIKLCDFGTSRILEGPNARGLTFIGTMHYMSPERLEGNRHAVAGDVFSLGLMLMELATGCVALHHSCNHPPRSVHPRGSHCACVFHLFGKHNANHLELVIYRGHTDSSVFSIFH